MKKLLLTLCALAAAALASGYDYTYVYILNDSTNMPIKWPLGTTAANSPTPITLKILLDNTKTLSDGNTAATSAVAAAAVWNNNILGDLSLNAVISSGTAGDNNGVNEVSMASTVYGTAFGTGVLRPSLIHHM